MRRYLPAKEHVHIWQINRTHSTTFYLFRLKKM